MNDVSEKLRCFRCFGIDFNYTSLNEVVSKIDGVAKESDKLKVIVVNAAVLVMCFRSKEFLSLVNKADIVTVDGMPLLWALKLMGHPIKERVSGPDLFKALLRLAAQRGYSTYFLGAEENTIRVMLSKLSKEYRSLKIAGFRNGFFKESEEAEIIESINSLNVDFLFLGLPSPVKEKLIVNNTLNVKLALGVGGVFDIEAGLVKRAPKWMQNAGLEWFYRLIQEPGRLWKRYLVTNSMFIYIVLREIFLRRFK